MFPIPWNFPFRKKNGNLVNIGDVIDEGTELPEHGEGDAGKVLSVDENGDLEWADAPTEIPDFDSSDEGKLLSVDENGDLEWSDEVPQAIQDLSNKLDDEIETRANVSAHNFLLQDRVPTSSNVTITVNEDKSITISGTTVSESYFQISDQLGLSGDFIASGCPSGGSNDTFFFLIVRRNADSTADEQTWKDFGDGVQISLESAKKTRAFIVIRANVTINATFYPMIRLASDSDTTYQPYAMTNRELTENVLSTISTKFIKIPTAELIDTYNPITIADELVATSSSEIVYVQVGANSNTTNPELYCPLQYTIYEIRHTGDTVTLNAIAYNQDITNLIYTIGRSRNSNWGTWNKTLRATLVSGNLTKVESNIAWFAGYDAKVYKQGRIAEISIRAAASGQIMPDTALFTIPSGFLPNRAEMQLSGYVDMITAATTVPCRVYVDNGSIKLNVGMEAGDNLYISGMYFIAD